MTATLELVSDPEQMQDLATESLASGKTIALVPTMGALHQGHLSLVETAKQKADVVIVSVFVNPTQFNDPSDLEKYPRELDKDLEKLQKFDVDFVFAPSAQSIYPQGQSNNVTQVVPGGICKELEGEFRPGHFQGVVTVVAKLFHLCRPTFAIFGQKDYQQLAVIRAMVRDLNFPVEIVAGKTVRETTGLALSSRNARLDESQKETASCISRSLNRVQEEIDSGQTDARELSVFLMQELIDSGLDSVDYAIIVDQNNLEVLDEVHDGCVALVAGYVGQVRLIDNLILNKTV